MFPPAAVAAAPAAHSPGDRASVVHFEPLPELRPAGAAATGAGAGAVTVAGAATSASAAHSRRPAAFNSALTLGLSANDWFEDPHSNFPRSQLKYLRLLGRGWFGRAVEGEAQGISGGGQQTTSVVVKILHEDATPTDHMFFLHEAKPYRDLRHPNVLRLLGRCLETDPFLVLLEACPSGDLKSFLSQNISTAEALSHQGVTLLMGCHIAAGLQFMHQHGFVHTDLAARNCLVTSDLTVKVGDYGISIDTFKEDYYCTGDVALPIRWCAPETLHCTETTIETKEVTPCANVWSLGVVLWEICEFGKLPYTELTDDEVIVKVLGDGSHRLGLPSRSCPHRHNLYHLMKLCWSPAAERPVLSQVLAMLNHLYSNREFASIDGDICSLQADEDFERRWEMFKPNSIPVTDNHIVANSTEVLRPNSLLVSSPSETVPPVLVTSNLATEMRILNAELHKSSTLPQPSHELLLTPQESPFILSDTSPLTTSPQPSLTSSSGGEIFVPSLQQRHKSPSLQNLRGSLDDLSECNGEVCNDNETDFIKQEMVPVLENEVKDEDHRSETVSEINTAPDDTIGTSITEPDFDSWLQGVETTDEEDAKFVRKISEAIRDLDNALALEKTSSSSSAGSSKCGSHQPSPVKDVAPIASEENVVLDFRLGPTGEQNDSFISKGVLLVQPDSFLDDSLAEKSLPRDINNRATDSGTDTEDETWRKRIECGEFSAKVKEKSKSVADLMVLTHIDCSDGSDSEPPSLTWTFDRGSNSRNSFTKQRRGSSVKGGNLNTNALAFASESNIHQAVLGEEFKNTLLKLHEAQKDSKSTNKSGLMDLSHSKNEALSVETLTNSADPLLPTFVEDNDDFDNLGLNTSFSTPCNTFLVNDASENDTSPAGQSGEGVIITLDAENKMCTSTPTCSPEKSSKEHVSSFDEISVMEKIQNSSDSIFSVLPEICTADEKSNTSNIVTDCSEALHTAEIDNKILEECIEGNRSSPHPQDEGHEHTKPQSLNRITNGNEDTNDEEETPCATPNKENDLLKSSNNFPVNIPVNEDVFSKEADRSSNLKHSEPHSDINCGVDLGKTSDWEDPSEVVNSIEKSLSDSSLRMSNSDSRDATFNSSEIPSCSNASVPSGISTDSFEYVPAVNADTSKVCSTPTDPLDNEQKEISTATNNENMTNSISEGSVILGPCEDYTLDYFKGLKTISNDSTDDAFLIDDFENSLDTSNNHPIDSSCIDYSEDSSEMKNNDPLSTQEKSSLSINDPSSNSYNFPIKENVIQTSTLPLENMNILPSSNIEENCDIIENKYANKDITVSPDENQPEKILNTSAIGSSCILQEEEVDHNLSIAIENKKEGKDHHGVSENFNDEHCVLLHTTTADCSQQCTEKCNKQTNVEDSEVEVNEATNNLCDSANSTDKHRECRTLERTFLNEPVCVSVCENNDCVVSSDVSDSLNIPNDEQLSSTSLHPQNSKCSDNTETCLTPVSAECADLQSPEIVPCLSASSPCENRLSFEGVSDESSTQMSLENEVPTVVTNTLDRSIESNLEYNSSETLTSLDHSPSDLEVQDKYLDTFDEYSFAALFDDKKAASYTFLQQEINAENLYRQRPVINVCHVQPPFPQIMLESDKYNIDINTNGKLSSPENNPLQITSDLDVPSVNIMAITPLQSDRTSPEIHCKSKHEKTVDILLPDKSLNEICAKSYTNTELRSCTPIDILESSNKNGTVPTVYKQCSTIDIMNVDSPPHVDICIPRDVPLNVPSHHHYFNEDNFQKKSTIVELPEAIFREDATTLEKELDPCHKLNEFSFASDEKEFLKEKQNVMEDWEHQDIPILKKELLESALCDQEPDHKYTAMGLTLGQDFMSDFPGAETETAVELEDGEDFGLDVAKHSTPDDERSSDSGFRDKGSLSESCEDACDEKYNLEDIEAELEETFNKGGFNYVVKGMSGDEDDLEHHTSSEEIPHEHLDHHDDTLVPITLSCDSSDICSASCEAVYDDKNGENFINFDKKYGELEIKDAEHNEESIVCPTDAEISHPLEEIITKTQDCKYNYTKIPENTPPQNMSPPDTPDLLNIETNDTPMPDLTSLHTNNSKLLNMSSIPAQTEHSEIDQELKNAMSDGFDVNIQSRFNEEKNLMLDIGQTEFRTTSPEQVSPIPTDGSAESSPVKRTGWFLHPQSPDENNENNYEEGILDDVFMSPSSMRSTSSTTSNVEDSNSNDNNCISFSLNEEFVAAIRNELQEKLPCARQQNFESAEDDGCLEPEDELSQDERADITIHYNAYPPPLSPILEERESVSSITTTLSDNIIAKGTVRPDSDSEPGSPVFLLDPGDTAIVEVESKKFEEEIREALENCSFTSGETDSLSDKEHKNRSVVLEDLEPSSVVSKSDPAQEVPSSNITVVKGTYSQSEYDDDVLVVDTETNEATLLESPKPKSHLAFIKKQSPPTTEVIEEISPPSDLLNSDSIVGSSEVSSNICLKVEVNAEGSLSDEEAFTPDSISPGRDRDGPCVSQVDSGSDNVSGVINSSDKTSVSSSDKASVSLDSIELHLTHPTPNTHYQYFENSFANPSSDTTMVEHISIGVTNNEAAEIISELENSGVFSYRGDNDIKTVSDEYESTTKFSTDDLSKSESDNEESEEFSIQESSDSLSPDRQISKKCLSLDLSSLHHGTGLKRFQTQVNVSTKQAETEEEEEEEEEESFPPAKIEITECEDEGEENGLRLTDTLDLYKKKRNTSKQEAAASDADWSVTSLEAALLSTKAPMPSPEDESWKQIPSMLAFSDLNEMMSRCGNEEGFSETDITSPGYPSHDNDEDLMSTSFSLKDSEDIGDCYTPDWESDDDTNDDDNNSSSSGEFIWKPFEGMSEFGMEVIAEEEEDEDDDDDDSMSSGSGTEFIPSAWNSEATPNRSALRSPDKKQEQKKTVSFKKQKYYCVYEYPREASDSETESLDSPSRRRWDMYQQDVDYASYADWELMEGDVAEASGPDTDTDPEVPQSQPSQSFDFYKLSNVDYDFSTGVMSEDGEFYISSSARPFQFNNPNTDVFSTNGSEFFPGQLYNSSDDDLSAQPAEIKDVNLQFLTLEDENDCTSGDRIFFSEEENSSVSTIGQKTDDSQPDSKATEELLNQSVSDSPKIPESTEESGSKVKTVHSIINNFAKDLQPCSSPVESSPTSPLSPTSGLGELRHTRDRLKLDLPLSGSTFVLDPPAAGKRRSVEAIKGEASLLDSGEETEDSGIESSNGVPSTKHSTQNNETISSQDITSSDV